MRGVHLRELVRHPRRYREFSCGTDRLVLDYSRQRISGETRELLLALAKERSLEQWIEALFSGACVNTTEHRPALHTALRSEPPAGEGVPAAVFEERRRMLDLARAVRSGAYAGVTGARITDVVNIGIGGSDLGVAMAGAALHQYCTPDICCHFVSNIDGSQLADALAHLDPATTLFIICSKSFTTLETRLNAEAARRWVLERLPRDAVARHFLAVSVNDTAMDAFGIDPSNRFTMWDWVGGRYSMWSSIGLVLAIAIGPEHFEALLRGARAMDAHFRTAPPACNLPVLLGLLAVWNQNFLGITSHVVLPYDQRLHRLPAFLQQLHMESLGKGVTRGGAPVEYTTGTVIWGEPGSNAQHSFFQLLHQGTARFSADFVAPANASSPYAGQHQQGLANMLAQAEAFALGQSAQEAAAAEAARTPNQADAGATPAEAIKLRALHKVYPGNHPNSILLFPRLDPCTLGTLIALYEHKVFVQSVIWGVNPFDQWGVELGKSMATSMHKALEAEGEGPGIAAQIRAWRQT